MIHPRLGSELLGKLSKPLIFNGLPLVLTSSPHSPHSPTRHAPSRMRHSRHSSGDAPESRRMRTQGRSNGSDGPGMLLARVGAV